MILQIKQFASCIVLIFAGWHVSCNADDLVLGKRIYQGTCAKCHDNGVAGAPHLYDRPWRKDLPARGKLNQHALVGFGAMPAKGGNPKLSQNEVISAVSYMIENDSPPVAAPISSSTANLLPNANISPNEHPLTHQPPAESEIPADRYGDDVRLGKNIFTHTKQYAGRYTGNGLNCSNCHLDAGRKANAAPMWAAIGMYPAYRSMNDRNNTLEERIQHCFRFSMDGFSPAVDAPEIRALKSYFHFLARGVPIGKEMPGRNFPQIKKTGFDPSPTRGAAIYKDKCASCHNADGSGKKNQDTYLFPPLWGFDTYNKGAGFSRNGILAGFIKANMPIGQEWSLSDQQSLDVAAYINLQLRSRDPRKGMLEGIFD